MRKSLCIGPVEETLVQKITLLYDLFHSLFNFLILGTLTHGIWTILVKCNEYRLEGDSSFLFGLVYFVKDGCLLQGIKAKNRCISNYPVLIN